MNEDSFDASAPVLIRAVLLCERPIGWQRPAKGMDLVVSARMMAAELDFSLAELATGSMQSQKLKVHSPPSSPEAGLLHHEGESSVSLDGDSSMAARRPDLSYAHLAALAIDASGKKRCTVGEIYSWIEANFPFFKSGCPWWKVFVACFIFKAVVNGTVRVLATAAYPRV